MCQPGTQTQLYFQGQRITRKVRAIAGLSGEIILENFLKKLLGKPDSVKETSKEALIVKILTLMVFHCQRQAVVINKPINLLR
jgi:hypothetical protein